MSTPKKTRKPKKKLTDAEEKDFQFGVDLHESGQPLPEDANEQVRAGYESVPEEEVPKTAVEQLKEEYETPASGEFAAYWVAPEATEFHVVSNGGVLCSPKSKKPLVFNEADAAEVSRFIAEARPNDGVHVRPIS